MIFRWFGPPSSPCVILYFPDGWEESYWESYRRLYFFSWANSLHPMFKYLFEV